MTYQEALEVIRKHATLDMIQKHTGDNVAMMTYIGAINVWRWETSTYIPIDTHQHIDFAEHVLELLDKKDNTNDEV